MKKLAIAIIVLGAAVVSASSLNHHKQSIPSTKQTVFPVPSCPPDCAVPTPSQTPN